MVGEKSKNLIYLSKLICSPSKPYIQNCTFVCYTRLQQSCFHCLIKPLSYLHNFYFFPFFSFLLDLHLHIKCIHSWLKDFLGNCTAICCMTSEQRKAITEWKNGIYWLLTYHQVCVLTLCLCWYLLWILWFLYNREFPRGATLVIKIWSWSDVTRRWWSNAQGALPSSCTLSRPLPRTWTFSSRSQFVLTFPLPRWGRYLILCNKSCKQNHSDLHFYETENSSTKWRYTHYTNFIVTLLPGQLNQSVLKKKNV